jgi:hypothetical protein
MSFALSHMLRHLWLSNPHVAIDWPREVRRILQIKEASKTLRYSLVWFVALYTNALGDELTQVTSSESCEVRRILWTRHDCPSCCCDCLIFNHGSKARRKYGTASVPSLKLTTHISYKAAVPFIRGSVIQMVCFSSIS